MHAAMLSAFLDTRRVLASHHHGPPLWLALLLRTVLGTCALGSSPHPLALIMHESLDRSRDCNTIKKLPSEDIYPTPPLDFVMAKSRGIGDLSSMDF